MLLTADFHIHSCLSPCGDLTMSPTQIVKTLKERGVQLAALTDHNSSLNCPAFQILCKKAGIAALYGMEAQTTEEVHVLCLFSHLKTALDFSNEIYELMPPIMNNPEKMGDQVYVDEEEDILGEVEKYLVTSANINLDDLAEKVHSLGGLVIPAHVDRPAFSLTSQLGFIPTGDWDALEVVRMPQDSSLQSKGIDVMDMSAGIPVRVNTKVLDTRNYPLITSSDAHYIEHIARRSFLLDIGDDPLYEKDGSVSLKTIKAALLRRPC
jgi:PHP family Zn ribbon phosphoesterase